MTFVTKKKDGDEGELKPGQGKNYLDEIQVRNALDVRAKFVTDIHEVTYSANVSLSHVPIISVYVTQ